ncbi:MAG: N-acetyl-1-D-myo-inositol-2-amino-2-deoxy-alpha-D-glucopyranoside deacetylase [Candidatus Nanopelagicales bacterium]|nr:N-acetyl-1-D-myo-inositol-2-amino-2-deoxy-alpha-D-glucopyranoside deacetylase [Candidatus Nanopelagicales bacterium]
MAEHGRRLMVVHAHPDDEVITTGGLMAKHAAGTGSVTLVTCTLGEEGEILLPGIQHLHASAEGGLGEHRMSELAASMSALGVTDFRFLGGAGKYRDSGMMGEPSNEDPDSFWRADLRDAATDLVEVIRDARPHVLVTYDDFGGYGHPDHIQAHRVTTYAAALAQVASYRPDIGPVWDVPKIYWTAFPIDMVRAGIEALRAMGDKSDFASLDADDLPFACPTDWIGASIDVSSVMDRKVAALRAHASQINMGSGFFALADNVGTPVFAFEHFRLAKGQRGDGPIGQPEDDLFSGVAL